MPGCGAMPLRPENGQARGPLTMERSPQISSGVENDLQDCSCRTPCFFKGFSDRLGLTDAGHRSLKSGLVGSCPAVSQPWPETLMASPLVPRGGCKIALCCANWGDSSNVMTWTWTKQYLLKVGAWHGSG